MSFATNEWRPLNGVKVVEFDSPGGVTFAARMLSGMGADVIRICRPGTSETGPLALGREWAGLDLKTPQDQSLASRLIERADVLLEGFRPGVMERLGLGPEQFHQSNPNLIYTRLSGWGQSGPRSDKAGHDLNYVAVSGLLDEMTPDGETPRIPPPLFADVAGGGHAALMGVLLALADKRTTARGCVLDVSMLDGVVSLLTPQWARRQRAGSTAKLERPYYRLYQTADDRYLAVGCLEETFYRRFVATLGLDESLLPARHEPESWPELTALFAQRIRSRSLADWEHVFSGVDACVTPVLTLSESQSEPQIASRELLKEEDNEGPLLPVPALRTVGQQVASRGRTRRLSTAEAATKWA
jgi:alpha-methylacyl-CoA racemase